MFFNVTANKNVVTEFEELCVILNHMICDDAANHYFLPEYNSLVEYVINERVAFFKNNKDKKYNQLHRLDGPARILKYGPDMNRNKRVLVEWWINGKNITEEITSWANQNGVNLFELSEMDKALIKVIWG